MVGSVAESTERWRRPSRYLRLRRSIGRHPSDLVRMLLATGVVVACLVAARARGVNPVESAIFNQLERLPTWSVPFWTVLTWVGWWPGIAAATALAAYLKRLWVSVAVALSGALAWVLILVVHRLVGPRAVPPAALGHALRLPGGDGFFFPSLHAAIVAALATTVVPYLNRSLRAMCWALVVLVAAADVVLGHNLPLGAFAGAVLGWGTGTLFHFVLGAPGRRTPESEVHLALHQVGLDGARIVSVRRPPLRPHEYDLVTVDGDRLQMKVVRRLHRSTGPAYKLRRLLASVEVEQGLKLSTPAHEIAHEAFIALLAERSGIPTLPVLVAAEMEHGPPFLIRQQVEGRALSRLSPAEVTDEVLDAIWGDVAALTEAHITHHDLRAANILLDSAGLPRIMDFSFSTVGGPLEHGGPDVADTLVALASVVGVDRSVASAVRTLSTGALHDALPHLQWLTLHRRVYSQLNGSNTTLAELRSAVAKGIGEPTPSFRSPVRVSTMVMMLAGGLAIYLVLPELSSLSHVTGSLARADWRWLAASVVTGLLAMLAGGVSVLGSSRTRLPTARTLAVQVAATFTGRTTAAGIGFYRINLVFLERLGFSRARAAAVLALNRLAMGVVSAVLTVLGIVVVGNAVPVGKTSSLVGWPLVVAIVVVLAAATVFLSLPFGRRRVLRPLVASVREVLQDLVSTIRQPIRFVQLVGGSALFVLASAAGVATTLAAFHQGFPVLAVLAVAVVGSTLGQLVPTPGGLGAVEGALVVGLTAVGIEPGDAVAATLASRLLTFWLPVLPGVAAFRLLQHHDVI
jgi:glycosyltransferase 2 family protein